MPTPTPYYRVGQYAVDTSTPTAPVLYRCTTAGDKTSSVWAVVSGAAQRFLVKNDLGSCLKCTAWDGINEGAVIYVAKKESIRIVNTGDQQSGVFYTYTYAQGSADATSLSGDVPVSVALTAIGDGSGSPNLMKNDVSSMHYWTRTVSGTDGSTEVDVITPPLLFNCIIKAIPITPEILDGNSCAWQEITGREWAIKKS